MKFCTWMKIWYQILYARAVIRKSKTTADTCRGLQSHCEVQVRGVKIRKAAMIKRRSEVLIPDNRHWMTLQACITTVGSSKRSPQSHWQHPIAICHHRVEASSPLPCKSKNPYRGPCRQGSVGLSYPWATEKCLKGRAGTKFQQRAPNMVTTDRKWNLHSWTSFQCLKLNKSTIVDLS